MDRLRWTAGLMGVLLAAMAQGGVAGEADSEQPVYEMEEMVVTATRTKRAIKDLAATVSVLSRADIEASNANSCTDILGTLPGLFVQRTGAFGRADVDIRGLGERGRKVMVLVDGRPVKMGLFGCTVTHSLPLNNVERIEVVRGPASVLYGSDALGGVVNIITRRPSQGQELDFTFGYGTHETVQHRVRAGASQGPLRFYATADRRQSDGHMYHSAYDGRDYTAQAGYQLTPRIEGVLSAKYFEAHKEEPLRATDPDTLVAETWDEYERGAVDLTLSGAFGRWDSSLKVYRNFGEHTFSDGWHSKDFTNGVMLQSSTRIAQGNQLSVGGEFRQQGGKSLGMYPGEWDKSEYAIFLHDEQLLLGRCVLTFGARYNQDEAAGGVLCPQGGVVVHLREGTSLRAAVNKAFRGPQINELYLYPPANKDLDPEEVWSYEAGVTQRVGRGVEIDLVAYRMEGDNLIQKESVPGRQPPFQFQNTGRFEFKGMEAALAAHISQRVRGRLGYTYLDPGDHTLGRPGDKVDGSLLVGLGKAQLSLTAQYVADYFAADDHKEPIPDYWVAGARLSYAILPGVRAVLAVDNLFDERYDIYVDLPSGAGLYSMPGRTLSGGLVLAL